MKNHFSDAERELLRILGRRKMTITQIVSRWDGSSHALDRNNYIASVIRRINKKCKFYGLKFIIAGKGGGRAGKTVWKETR
jgi:hypothetical protein